MHSSRVGTSSKIKDDLGSLFSTGISSTGEDKREGAGDKGGGELGGSELFLGKLIASEYRIRQSQKRISCFEGEECIYALFERSLRAGEDFRTWSASENAVREEAAEESAHSKSASEAAKPSIVPEVTAHSSPDPAVPSSTVESEASKAAVVGGSSFTIGNSGGVPTPSS